MKWTTIFILILITTFGYGARVNGKWNSTTANTIYLHEDPKELRVQVVLKSGETYTWIGKWLKKGKMFRYKNNIDTYKASIENKNTILVMGENKKELFVWRRANPIKSKKRRAKKKRKTKTVSPYPPHGKNKMQFKPEPSYDYGYVKVAWDSKRGSKVFHNSSVSRNKTAKIYGDVNAYGTWIAMIVPVISLEYESYGVSVIFERINGQWQLKYMRPMKIVRNGSGKYDWQDCVDNSIPIGTNAKWKLKTGKNNQFYFEFNGSIKLGPNKWIKKIKVKGTSKSLTR